MSNLSQVNRLQSLNNWLWKKKGYRLTPRGFCNGDAAFWGLSILDKDPTRYSVISEYLSQGPTIADFEKLEKSHFEYIKLIQGKTNSEKESIQKQHHNIYLEHLRYLALDNYLSGILLPFDPARTIEGLNQHDYERALSILTGGYVDESPSDKKKEQEAKEQEIKLDIPPIVENDWLEHNISKQKDLLIDKEFVFGLILKKTELIEIIPKIVPQNKLVLIGSPDHTCACFFDGNHYLFFDPNSEVGQIECADEYALANAVHQSLIAKLYPQEKDNPHFDNIPVIFSVLDYKKKTKAIYPDKEKLINDIFTNRGGIHDETVNMLSVVSNETALTVALKGADKETARILLTPPFESFHLAQMLEMGFKVVSRSRDIDLVQKLIDKGVPLSAKDAAGAGDFHTLLYLLDKGASSVGLLQEAARCNKIKIFEYLFRKYPYSHEEIKSAFISASSYGNEEIVDSMLKNDMLGKQVELIKAESLKERLRGAILLSSNLNVVKSLLQEAKTINESLKYPFIYALNEQDKKMACLILEEAGFERAEFPEILKSRPEEIMPLVSEFFAQNKDNLVDKLPLPDSWRQNINLPMRNSSLSLLMHYVSNTKDYKMVEFLLKNGADPNLPTQQGEYPLEMAIDERMIALLVRSKARVKQLPDGQSVILQLSRNGDSKIVELLLDSLENQDLMGEYGKNILVKAKENNDINLIKQLLARGLDIKESNHEVDVLLKEAKTHGVSNPTRYQKTIALSFEEERRQDKENQSEKTEDIEVKSSAQKSSKNQVR